MSGHLRLAQELKEEYPKETEVFTVFEIERIWEEYSDSMAAGWILPEEAGEVQREFDRFRG